MDHPGLQFDPLRRDERQQVLGAFHLLFELRGNHLSQSAGQAEIENQVILHLQAAFHGHEQGIPEQRSAEGKAVIFAALAADIGGRGGFQVGDQRGVEFPAQPLRASAAQVHADNAGVMSAPHKFPYQQRRRIAPQWLDMFKPCALGALFVPGANIRQMDIAENNAAHAGALQVAERFTEREFKVSGMGVGLHQRQTHGIGLCLNVRAAHAVEAHAAGVAFVHVHQMRDVQTGAAGAVQSQQRILAAAPEHGVSGFHAVVTAARIPTGTAAKALG